MKKLKQMKKRLFEIVQIGNRSDILSALFDYFIVFVIAVNLFITIFLTYDASEPYTDTLKKIEFVTILIFVAEYVVRLWTANYLYPGLNPAKAVIKFIFSFFGLVDLLTILPYFLPLLFPAGAVAFRMFRVIRIFRLFRINSKYDAFNVIIDVLKEKRSQIVSSVCMIVIFMIAASLCMYGLENEAQPDNFNNAFSGIWWSASTLLTVGYGDIYPMTTGGRVMAIVISFLGVGMVAIPTGIISAGFVEQYTKMKTMMTEGEERDLNFITCELPGTHSWCRKMVKEITLPPQIIIILLIRNKETVVPDGNTVLMANDTLVMTAQRYKKGNEIVLKDIVVKDENDWVGEKIRDLDISRQEMILLIRRKGKAFVPDGNTRIKPDDCVVMYSRKGMTGADKN